MELSYEEVTASNETILEFSERINCLLFMKKLVLLIRLVIVPQSTKQIISLQKIQIVYIPMIS
jgi:membrane protein insertase Oxa1/YidC/SpoIIIJ